MPSLQKGHTERKMNKQFGVSVQMFGGMRKTMQHPGVQRRGLRLPNLTSHRSLLHSSFPKEQDRLKETPLNRMSLTLYNN